MLLGVYEVTLGLEELDWRAGQFGLAATVQSYEVLLIAAAALLFRRASQRRPAIVLALLELARWGVVRASQEHRDGPITVAPGATGGVFESEWEA